MTYREAFDNFINLKPLSSVDFRKAQKFSMCEGLEETFQFNNTIKIIIEQALDKMALIEAEDLDDVKETFEVFGISKNFIIWHLSSYAANDQDFQNVYIKHKNLISTILLKYYSCFTTSDCKYIKNVEAFRNAGTIEERSRIRKQNKISPEEIRGYVYHYCNSLDRKAQDDLYQELIEKLEETYIKPVNLEELYTDFLKSELSSDEYCSLHNLNPNRFFKRCHFLEDEKLKRQVLAKRTITPKDNIELAILYNELVINIKNGVLTDTGIRSFDFVDYYLFLNGRRLNSVPKIFSKFLSNEDSQILRHFFAKFKIATFVNIDNIINSNIEVNLEKDENGLPISGTGRTLTKEELISIIDFLVDNNIPLYDIVLNVAIRRYANNTLDVTTRQI